MFWQRRGNDIIQDQEKGIIGLNTFKISVLENEVKSALQALSSWKIAGIDGICRNKTSNRSSSSSKGPKQSMPSDLEKNTDQKGPKKSPKKGDLTEFVDYHTIS